MHVPDRDLSLHWDLDFDQLGGGALEPKGSAAVLAKYIKDSAVQRWPGSQDKKKKADYERPNVIELGAGVGLVGLTAAAYCGANVMLTEWCRNGDRAQLDLLQRNVTENRDVIEANGGSALAVEYDWASAPAHAAGAAVNNTTSYDLFEAIPPPSLVVGSDVSYDIEQIPNLVNSIKYILSRAGPDSSKAAGIGDPNNERRDTLPSALLAYTKKRSHFANDALRTEAEAAGLSFHVVDNPGIELTEIVELHLKP